MLKCNLCNGDTEKGNFDFYSTGIYNKNKFPLYRCKNCGIIFTDSASNRKNEFDIAYEGGSNKNPLINFIRYHSIYHWILNFCKRKKQLLDFGCGKGQLVSYLRQKKWQAYGVDPMVIKATTQSSSYKNFLFSSLEQLQENKKSDFGLVIFNFSLEHCNNPLLTLKKLYTILAPGALIFIKVPNFNNILKNKKLFLFQLKIPEHRYFFTPKSLKKLLKNSGFATLTIDTRFCITSALTIPCSLLPYLDPMEWLYEKRRIIKLLKGMFLAFLSLIFLPYILLESRLGHGAIIHAVAQKE